MELVRDLLPTAFLKEKIIDKSQKLVPQTFLKEYVMMHSLRERVVENSRNKKINLDARKKILLVTVLVT